MVEQRWLQKEDRWQDRALCLQHRLRDRFRVAVDQHRRRQRSNGYVSSVMQRWLQRFRHFRSQTLANSSTFYRKRVSNDFDTQEDSVLTQMLQAVAVPVIGNVCHVFMHGLNHVQIYGGEKLQQAFNRPEKMPLITVSNHIASMDDPLVIAALLPSSVLLHARNLRWTLCATDRCFRNPVTSAFFKCVKVLPVSRGEGIYQKGMDVAITKLNRGGWVHIFPEGSRSRDGGKTMGSVKRGAASGIKGDNKERTENLEAGFGGLKHRLSKTEVGVADKFHHLETTSKKIFEMLTSWSTTTPLHPNQVDIHQVGVLVTTAKHRPMFSSKLAKL